LIQSIGEHVVRTASQLIGACASMHAGTATTAHQSQSIVMQERKHRCWQLASQPMLHNGFWASLGWCILSHPELLLNCKMFVALILSTTICQMHVCVCALFATIINNPLICCCMCHQTFSLDGGDTLVASRVRDRRPQTKRSASAQ